MSATTATIGRLTLDLAESPDLAEELASKKAGERVSGTWTGMLEDTLDQKATIQVESVEVDPGEAEKAEEDGQSETPETGPPLEMPGMGMPTRGRRGA